MTTGVIVTFSVPPERVEALLSLYRTLREAVTAEEPANLTYSLMHAQGAADCFKLIEIYRDAQAFERHIEAPHVAQHLPELLAFFGADASVVFLETVEN